MDNLATMKEFAQIIRGEHPTYRGDRRENAGFFLRTVRDDLTQEAKALAEDIENNVKDYSDETGLPFRTLHQAANVLANRAIDL